jgi:hypothetical protein
VTRVEIDGLPQVRAALAALATRADAQLDTTGDDVADVVAARTRVIFPIGPAARGHARSSIGVEHRPGMAATVTEGSARYPYAAWIDFGGRVGRRHSVRRVWIRGGRYLFRMYHLIKPTIEPRMHEGLRAACRESGWNPRG